MNKLKLSIDMIPSTSFMDNVRKAVSKESWDILRRQSYKDYNYCCGVCGVSQVVLECHEIWSFDDKTKIQKLDGLIALCHECHKIKHIGFAMMQADQGLLDIEKLIAHFMKVNRCNRARFDQHFKSALKTWEKRSKKKWTVDLGECTPYAEMKEEGA